MPDTDEKKARLEAIRAANRARAAAEGTAPAEAANRGASGCPGRRRGATSASRPARGGREYVR